LEVFAVADAQVFLFIYIVRRIIGNDGITTFLVEVNGFGLADGRF
jgi:hypothetical protein